MRPWRTLWLTIPVVGACLICWAFWLEPASLRVREQRLELGWPATRAFRVTVVSDLHVGSPYHGIARLPETVDRINATGADLICILGDLVTMGSMGGTFVPPEPIAAQLGRLRAPEGVVAVLGNHDRSFDGPRVRRALERVGIRVLEDTAARLDTPSGPLWIAGISDYWTARHDVSKALAAVTDSVAPVILITHNPDIFPRVPARVLLTLAGHTHGGQVRFPILGAPIVPSRFGPRFTAGHIIEDGRHLFVSTGIGNSAIPVRFMVPPTIFVLQLEPVREAA
jgi:predicted MPP superfamily phosphohydrolase